MFAIGHSLSDTRTFLPQSLEDEITGLRYVDTVGLNTAKTNTMDGLKYEGASHLENQ